MIPTRKIKKLILSVKKNLNNHINENSIIHISKYLIIREFIETRKWLQGIQDSIKLDLKRDFWDICINNDNIDYYYKSLNKLNAELSNELKNTVIEIFTIDQTYSTEDPLLNDPILTDIQNLSNIIQYFHFISNDKEENISRKASGSYYTPPGVIIYILNRLKSDILMNIYDSDNIRILDYSCGMGAFLIYATAFVSLQNFKNINFSFWG
ncbi:MAG: N-6 DNA methylase, partial [Promethearchaeota archaeon]